MGLGLLRPVSFFMRQIIAQMFYEEHVKVAKLSWEEVTEVTFAKIKIVLF